MNYDMREQIYTRIRIIDKYHGIFRATSDNMAIASRSHDITTRSESHGIRVSRDRQRAYVEYIYIARLTNMYELMYESMIMIVLIELNAARRGVDRPVPAMLRY